MQILKLQDLRELLFLKKNFFKIFKRDSLYLDLSLFYLILFKFAILFIDLQC